MNVAKNVNCHLDQLVISLFFAVIVLGTRHSQVGLVEGIMNIQIGLVEGIMSIHIDLVEGIMKNLISRKNECTREYVLSVETNAKCRFDLQVGNLFTVATVSGRVTTLEARTLNNSKC